jgi:hypothetical protein
MDEVPRSSVIDMQPHRKERHELQILHEILLASQDEPTAAWPDESAIIAERETYDAIMVEVLPFVANSSLRQHRPMTK